VRKRHALVILAPIGLVWITLGWLATNPVIGNHPELRVMVGTPDGYDLLAQRVAFAATDGVPLIAWWLPARPEAGPACGTVILAHGGAGNRSHMLSRAAFLVRSGYNALAVDLRMHGESGGYWMSPGYEEARDVLGGVAYVRQRGERGPIILLGHSSGAVAALHAATGSSEVAAVIADGAFISYDSVMSQVARLVADDPHASTWMRIGVRLAASRALQAAVVLPMYALRTGHRLNLQDASVRSAIAALKSRPVLFIGGGRDSIVPAETARRMYDAASSPTKELLIIPGAGHNDTYRVNPHLYESAVLDFLRQAVPLDASGRSSRTCSRGTMSRAP